MKYRLVEGEQIPILEYSSTYEFIDIFSQFEDFMYAKLVRKITEILDNKLDDDYILLALLGDSEFMFGSPSCVWEDNLNAALQHYILTEQYEHCMEVTLLLKRLKE
tara:strand:- start:1153 stop:1470 length:318 start_codon:yes stop_codon:yes gene_type:complete